MTVDHDCTTHYSGCACREERRRQLEEALEALVKMHEADNAGLRHPGRWCSFCQYYPRSWDDHRSPCPWLAAKALLGTCG